ncbi:Glutathione S-transferase 3 [Leucoagaricus sp. SymC.cos]|nr:Glutathione S-transferase 3 [Leucoagaricus sp. SymC.cos]
MVLKLYGWFSSAPALAVALFLHEKNVPFEWVEVDLAKGEHKTSDFIAKHPFGQVPCIDDDGFVLFESRAIARYLDEKYPSQGMQFFPKDLHKRALVDQTTWAETFHFGRFATVLVFETLNKKYFGLETDANTVAESKSRLYAKLDAYEMILSKQKYIAGDVYPLISSNVLYSHVKRSD